MNIIIQSPGFTASNDLQNFITQKLNVLKSDKIVKANVTLYIGPDTEPQNNYCEILVEIPGNDLFVKKNSEHFEVSVTECIDVLNKMLSKSKDIRQDRRQADAVAIQDILSDRSDDVEMEDIVK